MKTERMIQVIAELIGAIHLAYKDEGDDAHEVRAIRNKAQALLNEWDSEHPKIERTEDVKRVCLDAVLKVEELEARLGEMRNIVAEISCHATKVRPVIVRMAECHNDHVWAREVVFGGPLLTGERHGYCPICGEQEFSASPWRLKIGDQILEIQGLNSINM